MHFRPGAHKEAGLSFSPIKAIISPRPIGWISSRGADGSINLAPYSYFNAISEHPPMVIFSGAPSDNSGHKDSIRNVIETKEFVVNIVSSALASAMNITQVVCHMARVNLPLQILKWPTVKPCQCRVSPHHRLL